MAMPLQTSSERTCSEEDAATCWGVGTEVEGEATKMLAMNYSKNTVLKT